MSSSWYRPAEAGPWAAARQAAVLLAVVAVLDLVFATFSQHPALDLLCSAGNAALAAAAWLLPWRRWNPLWQTALIPPCLLLISYSTVTYGGFESGNAPFLVLIHAWVGLNFPRWVTLATAPVTAVTFTVAVALVEPLDFAVAQGLILLPVDTLVGLLINSQLQAQRRDRDRISQIERWRAALTATLAHDLRSPLATMQAAVEMVRDDGDDMPVGERERLLASVQRQITRVTRLAASLLDMERVDSDGTLRLDRAVVPLAAAVREAAENVGRAGVTSAVPEDLTVDADPERLQQMLINLIGNALRHGAPPVVVRAERAGDWVSIEVRDHGPGVPADQRDSLFARFGRDGGDSQGVGLGLWIVDQLARAHGGRVRYEAAQPGARLILMLPDHR